MKSRSTLTSSSTRAIRRHALQFVSAARSTTSETYTPRCLPNPVDGSASSALRVTRHLMTVRRAVCSALISFRWLCLPTTRMGATLTSGRSRSIRLEGISGSTCAYQSLAPLHFNNTPACVDLVRCRQASLTGALPCEPPLGSSACVSASCLPQKPSRMRAAMRRRTQLMGQCSCAGGGAELDSQGLPCSC